MMARNQFKSTLEILAAKLAKHFAKVRAAFDDDNQRDEGEGRTREDKTKRPKYFPVFHRVPSLQFMTSLPFVACLPAGISPLGA